MSITRILTAAQMRRADEITIESGVSGFDLMDRAGRAVAGIVLEKIPDYGRVVVIAGPGNNGGDGIAAAHHLRKYRIPVTVVSLAPVDSITGDCKAHVELARKSSVKIREATTLEGLCEVERWLSRSVIVVDAIFGTGLCRPLDGLMAETVAKINACDRPVLSIDIASGICSDSGSVLGCAVKANYTLPIAASKWGHWLNQGRDYTGLLVKVADIGITDETICASWHASCDCEDDEYCFCVNSTCLINDEYLEAAWPPRPRLSHKGFFGHVWVFGGSTGYTGAPQLAGLGAYAAGAGLASIVCPDEVWSVVASANLEVMAHPESSTAWHKARAIVAGPGWGMGRDALLTRLLEGDCPMVLDADALNMLAASKPLQEKLKARQVMTVITPHPGEAARLLGCDVGAVQDDRKQAVLDLVERYKCWVVLKGSETLVASPERDIYLNPFGTPHLAVAGSGDVLSGMIGAQLARRKGDGATIAELISSSVALHAKAGAHGGWYLAGELAGLVAEARQKIESGDRKGH
ncbi:ADP-dependent NAD(P)H-hydrate dehydratase / NAD(P)H-hydrate epimerase [Mariprofundus micogutta]|uniref:Bifunctional NAD(P)H-hydrate repair enzyme n=1 Tax=Mariprofundus micogutta TaxID=1921010 RepID=A0A1L8CP20_9PROT|nr:bifunctional ADP-dependent NAD(P)H-hydrate dehydratase/NAD(P)H-hydrate epimerase [Mariprofundus micogutta]GAV20579.1 ADP-dependent NAD(P)H-hydrate dehydratase / NAD(P)H-hydrate epimerase [Mariprofundus micogutta]